MNIMKKTIAGILMIGFIAALFDVTPYNTEYVKASFETKKFGNIEVKPQDITQPVTKSYILSESMNSIWIPVNSAKKGVLNFTSKAEGNTEGVYIALYAVKDVDAARKYNIVSDEDRWDVPLAVQGDSYIYIEKGAGDKGKSVKVTISTSFKEEVVPEELKAGERYELSQSGDNVDYKFVLGTPQKISFNIDYGTAYLLDAEKNICNNDIADETFYLAAGTYYVRIAKGGVNAISYTGKNVSIKKAANTSKKKAKKMELDENIYFTHKNAATKDLWYKIKSTQKKNISVTCLNDGAVSDNFVKYLTVYNSKGKKIKKVKGNSVTVNKGSNYIRADLSSNAAAGVLNISATEVYDAIAEENDDTKIISLENTSSLYAKDVINESCVISSYSQYSKVLSKIKKSYKKAYKGFNIKNDEFYKMLKSYDKSFFKKNSVCIYACDIPETGKMTDTPKFNIVKSNGKKDGQLAVTRRAYSGGVNKEAVSFYFVNVKTGALKGVTNYKIKENNQAAAKVSESKKQQSKWNTVPYKLPAEAVHVSGMMFDEADIHTKWLPQDGVVVFNTYEQYKKHIINSGEEVDECLKGYSKSYFNKNSLIVYTYTATDSGMNARGAFVTKENVNGANILVCSFVGNPYYGAGTESVKEYCYVAQVAKEALVNVTGYESRRVAMFD